MATDSVAVIDAHGGRRTATWCTTRCAAANSTCMALEDAVTLGEALRVHDNDFGAAFAHYQRSRIARTARVVLPAREMGRLFHAKGVERLVRKDRKSVV